MSYTKYSDSITNAIKEHAKAEFPRESLGYIYAGKYWPCENIHEKPTEFFRMSQADYVRIMKLKPDAVVHSHPNGPDTPTKEDMNFQVESGVGHGIVVVIRDRDGIHAHDPFYWGGCYKPGPLLGREFRHGVYDCYSLIKDTYRKKLNIELPEGPRSDNWWEHGEDLYMENFKRAGFRIISQGEARRWDLFLANIRSPTINHGGVYLGNGIIMHHLVRRLSRREPLGPWQKYATVWLRYGNEPLSDVK